MLKVGTIVSIISAVESLNGLVVPVPTAQPGYDYPPKGLAHVLIMTAGEFQGKTYPFQYHQLEIISEPS